MPEKPRQRGARRAAPGGFRTPGQAAGQKAWLGFTFFRGAYKIAAFSGRGLPIVVTVQLSGGAVRCSITPSME